MTKEIVNEVLSLPLEDRAELVDILIKSLNASIDPEIEEAWKKEIKSRFNAFNKGEITAINGEEFIRKLRKKIRR